MSDLVDELRGAEELILSVTDRSDWKSIAEHFRKAADRIEELESRELGYIQSLRELEARVRELERQNSLLLDDVQGIAEAVIPYCDASDFAYAVKRDCAETLKEIATKAE